MLSTLHTYLASLPAEHTTAILVLGALTPVFTIVLSGFGFCLAADRAAAKSWGL